MNMLAEQNHFTPRIATALEDMRAANDRCLETPGDVAEALRPFIRALALVGMETMDNITIHDACVHLYHYFSDIRKSPRALAQGEQNLLSIWPDALAACFLVPGQDHGAALNQIMAECGILPEGENAAPERDPVGAVDSAHNGKETRTRPKEAVTDLGMPSTQNESPRMNEYMGYDAALETAGNQAWEDTGGAQDAMEPVTAVLQALESLAEVVSDGAFSDPDSLTPEGVMRYAMSVAQLRENAELAGLEPLAAACDAISPVLARLMDAHEAASPEELEILKGFALSALDMNGPPETSSAEAESVGEPDLPSDAQQVSLELLGLLSAEIAGIKESLQPVLPSTKADAEPSARAQACEECGEIIERLGRASESIGLTALGGVLDHLSRNVHAAGSVPSMDLSRLIPDFLDRTSNYLTSPGDGSACAGLMDTLVDTAWPEPLAAEVGVALAEKLANVELVAGSPQGEARPEHASPEDVSLALPDDLNPVLLENLLFELPQQMGMFTEAIGRIADGSGALPDVETAKRAAHTLKGAANTVGVRGIASLTHHLEDILIAFSDRGVLPGASIASLLIRAGDCLETMNEALQGVGPGPDDAVMVLQEILDCANRIDRDGLAEGETTESKGAASKQPSAPAKTQETPEQVSMVRVPTMLIDELLRLVGEAITTNAQIQERLRLSVSQAQAVKAQNRLLHQLVNELDELVDIRGAASPVHAVPEGGDFDALEMERYSELHTLKNRLIEAVTDVQDISAQSEVHLSALGEVVEVQSRLQLESQEAVMRTRMVRVETIVPRLQRGVRQAARLLDKQVTLEVKGTDTLIDGSVLNELVDPLMHVLRNAVDHGIEDPGTRLANGKGASGHIELSFVREGNTIAVRCRDDGQGLNLEAIKSSALERGLIDGSQVLSEDEVARLILVQGFSTRNEATQISGRGIGMDIVNGRVQSLKGSLALHSKAGHGLNLEIRIPLSMLSTHALLVRTGDRMVALSTRNIEDIHYVTPAQTRQLGTLRQYQVNDAVHEVVRLESLLNLPCGQRAGEGTGFPLLLVRQSDGVMRAIEVQEIVDSRNLVMKDLGGYVPSIKGVAGAAILGDGSVVPVIDLPDLLNAGARNSLTEGNEEVEGDGMPAGTEMVGHRAALVVDDSLSARRTTTQVLKDAGYTVRTAMDGLEAVSILREFMPDVILADMEMPRMNGLELTSHVRGQPSTHDIPVIMITSRSTEKHRKQAQAAGVNVYLTKPFNDEILLQHVLDLTETVGA